MLWHGDATVGGVDAVVVPGGFAHGDYLRPGAIARFSPGDGRGRRLRRRRRARWSASATGSRCSPRPACCPGALQKNRGLKFLCTTVELRVETHRLGRSPARPTPATCCASRSTTSRATTPCDAETLAELRDEDRVVLRYVDNPNGSVDDIAGVCNEGRNVVGLMPHPERAMRRAARLRRRAAAPQSRLVGAAAPAVARVTAARPIVDPEVHRALGLTDDESDDDRRDPRPRAQPPRAGHVLGDVVRALLLQVAAASTCAGCRPRRRACWSARARAPAWSTSATASPPPSASRATTTRRAIEPYQGAATGVGGILRDIFSMGARPDRHDGPAAVRAPRRRPQPLDRRGRRVGHLRLRQLRRRADRRRRGRSSTRPTPSNPLVNVLCLGVLPDRAPRARPGRRASATSPCCSARPPGRDGIGGVSVLASAGFGEDEDDAGQAPERAGRRPVRGEAPHRGLPRAARPAASPSASRTSAAPASPCATRETAPQGRRRAWTSTSSRDAPARAGHGALRGDDLRVARSACSPSSSPRTSTRCSPSPPSGRSGRR